MTGRFTIMRAHVRPIWIQPPHHPLPFSGMVSWRWERNKKNLISIKRGNCGCCLLSGWLQEFIGLANMMTGFLPLWTRIAVVWGGQNWCLRCVGGGGLMQVQKNAVMQTWVFYLQQFVCFYGWTESIAHRFFIVNYIYKISMLFFS